MPHRHALPPHRAPSDQPLRARKKNMGENKLVTQVRSLFSPIVWRARAGAGREGARGVLGGAGVCVYAVYPLSCAVLEARSALRDKIPPTPQLTRLWHA